jgi:mitogen-activated protein kinase 15
VLEQYQVVKKIGSGAYGHVWKVVDRQSKAVKALKKNFDAFSNSTDAQRTYREIMFLRQLRHPNIVNLERTLRARNDRDIYLVFEHMDVDLHTLIREDGKSTNLEERHKQYIIYQIAKAIYLLHNCNLIHRDLKPSNVLINESCEAKLCDFGLVRFLEEPDDHEAVVMTDYIATRWYRAPELLLGCKDYSKQVDIWALGCLVGELFLGKAMFPGTSTSNQLEKVLAWTGAPTSAELKQVSANLNPAILQMLNHRKKINRNDFFQGKVSAGCLDLVSKML